jgi:capsular exopolysaccharide synthesis family protein
MALADKSMEGANTLLENTVESQTKLKITPLEDKNGGPDGARGIKSSGSSGAKFQADPNFPLVLDHANQMASESFSILRSRLLSVHNKTGVQSVVITSAEAGDGKTLVAANLALSLGQIGTKRVLLIDADLRAGAATRLLKLKQLPGLGEFLQGRKPFEAVVHPTGFSSLSIAPTGLVAQNTLPQILESPRWSEFIEQAKQKFDLIIVDSLPASAPVADLELLAAHCDAFLFVVQMRQTHRDALKRAVLRLDPKKFLGIVINNAFEIYKYDYDYYRVRSGNLK